MSWTVIGSVMAIPVAAYFIDIWLGNFAYKTDIPVFLYAIVILAATGITSLSVFYQTLVVAKVNPADILRHE
jgi:putative ABC transport system permease protein